MLGNYTMLYSGATQETRAQSVVAVMLDHKWTSRITDYSFINDRTVTVCLKPNRGHVTIIGVYVPEEDRQEETRRFYKESTK
jgi:hypothetical protein